MLTLATEGAFADYPSNGVTLDDKAISPVKEQRMTPVNAMRLFMNKSDWTAVTIQTYGEPHVQVETREPTLQPANRNRN